jgi:hypothetical protein
MTAPDAYLVEFRNGDVEILDPGDQPGAIDFVSAEPLEMLWSVDHGLRCGDETIGVIVVNTAVEIMFPLLTWLGLDTYRVDTWQAMADEIKEPDWTDGWTDGEFSAEYLNDLRGQMESAAADVGLIVESNGDCGMTWCYRRTAEK